MKNQPSSRRSHFLEKMREYKQKRIAVAKRERPIEQLEQKAQKANVVRPFRKALEKVEVGLIAEIKKASPSKGVIRQNFCPKELAQACAAGGATCLSVLTEDKFFQGAPEYLAEARKSCDLPILCKDFFYDPYQVVEARALGADCILIVIAFLSPKQAKEIADTAREYGMDFLVEVRTKRELEHAIELKPDMIGVNNRYWDHDRLRIDLQISKRIIPEIAGQYLAVVESGIRDPQSMKELQHLGARAFLIGEAIMREDDVVSAVAKFSGKKTGQDEVAVSPTRESTNIPAYP